MRRSPLRPQVMHGATLTPPFDARRMRRTYTASRRPLHPRAALASHARGRRRRAGHRLADFGDDRILVRSDSQRDGPWSSCPWVCGTRGGVRPRVGRCRGALGHGGARSAAGAARANESEQRASHAAARALAHQPSATYAFVTDHAMYPRRSRSTVPGSPSPPTLAPSSAPQTTTSMVATDEALLSTGPGGGGLFTASNPEVRPAVRAPGRPRPTMHHAAVTLTVP